MKKAVSVSLGSHTRDKRVQIDFAGVPVSLERIGTDGDEDKARSLLAELDGTVDVLGVGGIELDLLVGGRNYPIRAGQILIKDVHQTPAVCGSGLKRTLERRVFEFAAPQLGGTPHYGNAFMTLGIDRYGMALAFNDVSDNVTFGDLMFGLGIPIAVSGLKSLNRGGRLLLPIACQLPISMLYPTGDKQETIEPKYEKYWNQSELIGGDFLYIRKHMPDDLSGKTIVTNTTTEEDVELLKERNLRWLITTTPRYDGRSFGTNGMEAALTAYAGKERTLTDAELNDLIDELAIRPAVQRLND